MARNKYFGGYQGPQVVWVHFPNRSYSPRAESFSTYEEMEASYCFKNWRGLYIQATSRWGGTPSGACRTYREFLSQIEQTDLPKIAALLQGFHPEMHFAALDMLENPGPWYDIPKKRRRR